MRKVYIIFLLLLLFTISGCSFYAQQDKASLTPANETGQVKVENLSIENYFVKGKNLQVFDSIPRRIVVIGETEIETVLSMGLADRVVMAITSNNRAFAMRPENMALLQRLPKKNRAFLNVEYITSLSPDILIVEQDKFTRNYLRTTDYWNEHGVHTFVPYNTNTPSKHIYPETVENELKYIDGWDKPL